jgi:asparagine synthase (glutamine-hydrolysing)
MTGICGLLTISPTAESVFEKMVEALPTIAENSKLRLINPNYAAAGDGIASSTDDLVVSISGRPHWTLVELATIANQNNNAEALLHAYHRYGLELFNYLQGSFVFVIIDNKSKRLIGAIDRIGQQTLYYTRLLDSFVFGSTAASLLVHPKVNTRYSAQEIFNYTYFHMIPSSGCIYEGMNKLPAGHYLDYRADHVQIVNYWLPSFSESNCNNSATLAEEMRSLIFNSVNRASTETRVAAFLSGGLDSSTVAGMLSKVQSGGAHTYSIGFDAKGYDEMAYARIASKHFNTHQHEYYVTPEDVVNIVPQIAQCYDEPFGNSSAVPAYYCAKLAAENGVTCLLAGDGGDELFAGNERYAKQNIFEFYGKIPEILRRTIIESTVLNLPGFIPLADKAKSYIQQAKIALPERLQTYNFLHRIPLQDVFDDGFLGTVDSEVPLHLLRDQYQRPAQGSPLNRMMYLDWQFTLADNDLRKVNRMCALNGVEVTYPLLADELIAFSCRIPSPIKLRGRKLRFFYKKAMEGFLPTEILNKPKHGFGLPFGVWMRTHPRLQELGYDSLLALKKRAYFRSDFIDHAINLHRTGHAAYYGELIWILMMLELWFQAHS